MESLVIPKFTLVITTRCNLRCRMCCEYVPLYKPFPDMTITEERAILESLFAAADYVNTLHLSGGGEPFLHKNLAQMIKTAFEYESRFDRFMVFTNGTIPIPDELYRVLAHYGDKVTVQVSRYGINPQREELVIETLKKTGAALKIETYYGENQAFGGWVDFGKWEARNRPPEELEQIFKNCAVTRDMRGNWRTRDGKAHWCSRSQRGMELGLIPDYPDCYVDLSDKTQTAADKRRKFISIAESRFLPVCDYCTGDQGTNDAAKRFSAAEQII